MSTKVIVIGQENQTHKEEKKIELCLSWGSPRNISVTSNKVNAYRFVELVAKNYSESYDLIFCYFNEDDRGSGCVFLGHWNDGVV